MTTQTVDLERFATGWHDGDITVYRAAATLDERQSGEPVTRLTLLVSDPSSDTWDVDLVRDLRWALGRRATELGLPPISVTLVPQTESELFESRS